MSLPVRAYLNACRAVHSGTGRFGYVAGHEPKAAPTEVLTAAVWLRYIGPVPNSSGLQATSGLLVAMSRIYNNMLQKPEDEIDPKIGEAVAAVIEAFTADYTLDGHPGLTNLRNIDLLGQSGRRLEAQDGFIPQDGKVYRVMDITIPAIINDAWIQAS